MYGALTRCIIATFGRLVPSSNRMVVLDVLRGIAILLVMARHFSFIENAGRLSPLADEWEHVGWAGVDLFFVLSGFLVGGLLLREYQRQGTIDIKRFIIRRGFKIWPAYFVYVGFVAIRLHNRLHSSLHDILWTIGPNLLQIQNYIVHGATPTGASLLDNGAFLGHTWTLAIEEHFYLALPLVLWLLVRRGRAAFDRGFAVVAAIVLIGCLCARLIYWHAGGVSNPPETHLRVDSLFAGVFLAYLYHLQPHWWQKLVSRPHLLWLAAALLLLPAMIMSLYQPFMWTIGFTMVELGFCCIIAAMVSISERTKSRPTILTRGIAFIGVYSYSIYLWHITLGQHLTRWFINRGWLSSHIELHWLVMMTLYVAGATLTGVALGRLIEWPALAIRDQLFPSRVSVHVSNAKFLAKPSLANETPALNTSATSYGGGASGEITVSPRFDSTLL